MKRGDNNMTLSQNANINDYVETFKTEQEFLSWFKGYCNDCWFYDFGDCSKCKETKKRILDQYRRADQE